MPNRQKSNTVLIADDDEIQRFLLRCALEANGYEVVECESTNDAAVQATMIAPAAIITDVRFPEGSGIQLCKLLHSRCSASAPAIFVLSGDCSPTTRNSALAAGADAFFQKSADPTPMVHQLTALLNARATYRQSAIAA